jgi:hypothetical protein
VAIGSLLHLERPAFRGLNAIRTPTAVDMCSQFESGSGSAYALATIGDRGIYELSC